MVMYHVGGRNLLLEHVWPTLNSAFDEPVQTQAEDSSIKPENLREEVG